MAEVRALGPDDWQITRELRLAALLDAPDAFGGTYEQTSRRTEPEWRAWPAGGQVFAALRGGEPVGMACGVPSDEPGRSYLISMWVSPAMRGLGVGARLIEAVAGWARERGDTVLELDVYEHNEPARRSYVKTGFVEVGPCLDHPGAVTMRLAL